MKWDMVPEKKEIEEIILNLKNNKSSGAAEIIAETLKASGMQLN